MHVNASITTPTQLQLRYSSVITTYSLSRYKSYRAALYSLRINVINAVPTLLDKRLPISLVTHKYLIEILDLVHEI